MSGKEKRSNRKKKDVSIVIKYQSTKKKIQNDDYGKDF